jgi:hypothetical protein
MSRSKNASRLGYGAAPWTRRARSSRALYLERPCGCLSPGDRGGGAPGFRRRAGGRIRRTEPRFTRDIDLVVAVGDDTEAFVAALIADGHELVASVEHEAVRRLAMARLRLRDGSPLDLLFASSGIEPEIANAAEVLEVLPGFSVPVITTGHLIAVKILARDDHARPQDIADLRRLLAVASPEDLAVAHEAVALISERGFGRGRHLQEDLEAIQRSMDSSEP